MSSLLKLIDCGQSYWLDNLTREMIHSGKLKNRVEKQGLRGVTSNPAIFNHAITKSSDYDEQIQKEARGKKKTEQIYEALVIKDIQDACDVLRPVFDESNGLDGYVSLEVSPLLARDTEKTIDEARRLYKEVNRPNVLIKIPGTKEGIPAIEEMLYEGVNINVTLLFSVERYEDVAKAYVRALERRVKEGKPIDKITSVASFFLSRIDVLVDELLQEKIENKDHTELAKELLGKIAIASAKKAYQSFKKIFRGERWEALVQNGARVQRPLWASTSTKNPEYNDVMYVEPLLGKDTVNTMPDQTIEAFAGHGKVECGTIEKEYNESQKALDDLEKLGISLRSVTKQLVDEGIQKFIDPYNTLLKSIEEKAGKLRAK